MDHRFSVTKYIIIGNTKNLQSRNLFEIPLSLDIRCPAVIVASTVQLYRETRRSTVKINHGRSHGMLSAKLAIVETPIT
jgi:hypothetical protein